MPYFNLVRISSALRWITSRSPPKYPPVAQAKFSWWFPSAHPVSSYWVCRVREKTGKNPTTWTMLKLALFGIDEYDSLGLISTTVDMIQAEKRCSLFKILARKNYILLVVKLYVDALGWGLFDAPAFMQAHLESWTCRRIPPKYLLSCTWVH